MFHPSSSWSSISYKICLAFSGVILMLFSFPSLAFSLFYAVDALMDILNYLLISPCKVTVLCMTYATQTQTNLQFKSNQHVK